MSRFNSTKAEHLINDFVQSYIVKHGNTLYNPTGCVTEADKVLDPYVNYNKFMSGLRDYFFLNFGDTPTSCKWWSRNVHKMLKTNGIIIGVCNIDMFRREYTLTIDNVEKVRDGNIISFSMDNVFEITKSY